MENKRISPTQIPFLVRLTADLFREMREETKSPNDNPTNKLEEKNQMHFVADLLKDLVDTAYPIEEEPKKKYNTSNDGIDALIGALNLKPINKAILEDIEKDFQAINKMMKNYKSPKTGEF